MRTPVALAGLAAAALLAACGSSTATSTASTTSSSAPAAAASSATPSPSAAASTTGLASRSATEIVAATQKALASAPSVRVSGQATSDGATTKIDLRLKRDAGATGTIVVKNGTLSIVRVGKVAYLKGDRKFYTAAAGAQSAQLLAGKWIKVRSSSSSFASFLAFTDLTTFGDQVTKPTGTVRKGAVRTVDGQRGIEVTDGDGVLVVALDGPAYPLFIGPSKGSTGEGFTFSDYGKAVALAAPPAGQVVEVPVP